jgi:hypothetical protein
MQNKIPPRSVPSQSANDNGPLSSAQVKALKLAIAIMSVLIVAALLAIVGRVIYLSAVKKRAAPSAQIVSSTIAPATTLNLPAGAVIRNMSLHGDRLLVHYETTSGPGAVVLDLATGKKLSTIDIKTGQ